MKFALVLFFIFCVLGATLGAECGTRGCPYSYNPVCGKRTKNGKLETTTFPNKCAMQAANDCGEGYVPC